MDVMLWLSPKVQIDLDKDQITFTHKKKVIRSEPYVYVVKRKETYKVLAVAVEAEMPAGAFRVNIFSEDPDLPDDLDRLSLLTLVLQFGILRSVPALTLRPIAVLHGLDKFSGWFHGFEEGIFRSAALAAGATRVMIQR
jgi:hypothetical protein